MTDTNLKPARFRDRSPLLVAALPSMSLIHLSPFTRLRAGYGAAGEFTPNDPTSDSSFEPCNLVIAWTFVAIFLLVAASAFAQAQPKPSAKSVSPDARV
jgi:hypothetical protein